MWLSLKVTSTTDASAVSATAIEASQDTAWRGVVLPEDDRRRRSDRAGVSMLASMLAFIFVRDDNDGRSSRARVFPFGFSDAFMGVRLLDSAARRSTASAVAPARAAVFDTCVTANLFDSVAGVFRLVPARSNTAAHKSPARIPQPSKCAPSIESTQTRKLLDRWRRYTAAMNLVRQSPNVSSEGRMLIPVKATNAKAPVIGPPTAAPARHAVTPIHVIASIPRSGFERHRPDQPKSCPAPSKPHVSGVTKNAETAAKRHETLKRAWNFSGSGKTMTTGEDSGVKPRRKMWRVTADSMLYSRRPKRPMYGARYRRAGRRSECGRAKTRASGTFRAKKETIPSAGGLLGWPRATR
jgi:hypothetical protein